MDVIAGRKTVGRVTGDIMVNGAPKHQSSWARQVGYVEQVRTAGAVCPLGLSACLRANYGLTEAFLNHPVCIE